MASCGLPCFLMYQNSYHILPIKNTLELEQHGCQFADNIFKYIFKNSLSFDSNSAEVCFQWSNRLEVIIGSGNGLVPVWCQAIT